MPRHLSEQDTIEIRDLYNWGARVEDIAMLYDRHIKYISVLVKKLGCPARLPYRPALVNTKRNRAGVEGRIKSTRPRLPSDVVVAADGRVEIDRLLRSSARALQAQRIEGHQEDASIRSCQEAAS